MIVECFEILTENNLHLVSVTTDGPFQRIQCHGLISIDIAGLGKHDPDPEFSVFAPNRITVFAGTGQDRLPGSGIDGRMIVEYPRNRSLRTAAALRDIR